MNLTGITEPEEVITKHFIDSLTVLDKIDKENNIQMIESRLEFVCKEKDCNLQSLTILIFTIFFFFII